MENNSRFIALAVGTILVLILGVGGYFLAVKNKNTTGSLLLPSGSPVAVTSPSTAFEDTYQDPTGVFRVSYPNDFTLDESDKKHIRLFKLGPSQKGQTEMYDGILIVFEVINLEGKTLSDWIDGTITASTADGTTEIIEPKRAITSTTYPGFTYTVRGLGTSTYLLMQKDTSSDFAISITTLIADPTTQGFQTEVEEILKTLKILK